MLVFILRIKYSLVSRYSVIGWLDSFKLTGNPGVEKTSSIHRCISVITKDKIIKIKKPYREIIPILEIETLSDCSIKNLLYLWDDVLLLPEHALPSVVIPKEYDDGNNSYNIYYFYDGDVGIEFVD